MADSIAVNPEELTLDRAVAAVRSIPSRAAKLLPSSSLLSQAWKKVQQAPQAVSGIGDTLRANGVDTRPPSQFEIAGALRSAKDKLVGLWRGYVVPAFR